MVKMKPQQPDGCEDFIKTSNEADRFFFDFCDQILIL